MPFGILFYGHRLSFIGAQRQPLRPIHVDARDCETNNASVLSLPRVVFVNSARSTAETAQLSGISERVLLFTTASARGKYVGTLLVPINVKLIYPATSSA